VLLTFFPDQTRNNSLQPTSMGDSQSGEFDPSASPHYQGAKNF